MKLSSIFLVTTALAQNVKIINGSWDFESIDSFPGSCSRINDAPIHDIYVGEKLGIQLYKGFNCDGKLLGEGIMNTILYSGNPYEVRSIKVMYKNELKK
jgi:hypothetical protein